MLTGLGLLIPFILYIGFGALTQRLLAKSEEAQGYLDSYVFYLAVPALLLQATTGAGSPPGSILLLLGVTSAVTAAMFLLSMHLGGQRGADSAVSGLLGAYSNIGYMGPVLSVQLFGEAAGLPAAMIFCSEIIVLLTMWSMAITGGATRGLAAALGIALRHPFVLSVAAGLGLAAAGIRPTAAADAVLSSLSYSAAPCALFSLGLTLARQESLGARPGLVTSLSIKLALHPLLAGLGLWHAFGHKPVWLGTAILMASLPPAANIYVLARGARRGGRLAASGVMYGTLASVLTVPLVILFLTQSLIR